MLTTPKINPFAIKRTAPSPATPAVSILHVHPLLLKRPLEEVDADEHINLIPLHISAKKPKPATAPTLVNAAHHILPSVPLTWTLPTKLTFTAPTPFATIEQGVYYSTVVRFSPASAAMLGKVVEGKAVTKEEREEIAYHGELLEGWKTSMVSLYRYLRSRGARSSSQASVTCEV